MGLGQVSVRIGGLSPRVRGNHPPVAGMELSLWSIPACAGEPPAAPSGDPAGEVYPRVCGGTPPNNRPK